MATEVGAIYYTVDARTQALLKAEKDVDGSSRRMEKRFDQTDRASRRMSSGLDHAGGAALRLRNIVTAVSSAMATRQIIAYSDAWGRAQNQLRQVTSGAAELRDINQQLMDISNRSAVGFENTAGLYARVAQATRNLNIEQAQLIEFVDLTSQSMRAYGTSAAGAAALTLQLSQAFNAGLLQGEEFNTIMDQAPLLLEALQNETGKTSRELKKMGADGDLSIDMLIRSVRNYSDEINRRAAASTNTFADNLTVARNNMIEFVGSSDSAQGVVGKLGESVIYLSNNLETVTQGAIALSAVIAGRYATSLGAAAIANISLAGAHIRRMQALRAEAQASNQAATAKVADLQASRAIIQSTIREIEIDRAALAATLNTNQAKGTQIAIKRELVAMDNALAAAKGRLVAVENAETAATITATATHKANASTLAATTRTTQIATRAVGGLRTVMAFLGGPVGVIALAAYGIYSFREELGLVPKPARAASDIVDELRQRIDGLSESALKFEIAGLTAELFRLQLQAERTKSRLEELQPDTSAINGSQGPREALRAIDRRRDNAPEVRSLEQELEQAGNDIEARQRILEQIQDQLNGSNSNKPPVTPTSSSSSKSDNEAKRLARDFDAIRQQLETQRETIEREYLRRNETIRKATAAGSAEQDDLLRRSGNQRARELQELTDRLVAINATGIERINQQYDGQRQEILDITEKGSAEQIEALERNSQARARALAEERRNELQGLISHTDEVDAEYERQRRAILDHTRAGSAERQAMTEQAERSFIEAKMQAQNDDLANIAQHNQRVRDLEAEHYSLMLQQMEGFSAATADKMAEIRQATANPMRTLVEGLNHSFVTLDDTIAGAFSRGMMEGESFKNILNQIGQTVVGSLLQSFVKLGVQMLINAATAQTAQSAAAASAAAGGAAALTAWQPAAIAASIATFGAASGIGATSYIGAQAAGAGAGFMSQIAGVSGRQYGGSVTGGQPYRVTEDGKPEMLTQGTQRYIIPGANGRVTSNRDMSRPASTNVTINLIEDRTRAGSVEQRSSPEGNQVVDILVANILGDGKAHKALSAKYGLSTRASN
ncbi:MULTISPECIES: tape measure protein [unclassified Halomonas]|uniref:tape measure protein n=1 Tax=unclassified Halomonas TaxID=2609666 RepID=UPI00207686E7|nr:MULTISPECIES: tape measure protein [unclassified Halomonas]